MNRLDRAVNVILVLAALGVAVALVHREFFRPPVTAAFVWAGPPVLVKDWSALIPHGVQMDSAAPVTLVEFEDFECPYCRRFDSTFRAYQARYPHRVQRVFVHFPLPNHRFAMPAARNAECAAQQGRFGEMHKALFAKQDSFGLRPWMAYAIDAGIKDTVRFTECINGKGPFRRIDEGLAAGHGIAVRGTPTILVNGWRFAAPPTDSILSQTIEALLGGRKPPVSEQRITR